LLERFSGTLLNQSRGETRRLAIWSACGSRHGFGLGIAILVVVGMRLLGRPLPLIETDRAALLLVIALAAIKVAVAAVVPLTA
jgi:hypothetical protein